MGKHVFSWRAAWLPCLLGLLVACGGGSEPPVASPQVAAANLPQQAADTLRRRASGLQVQAAALPSLELQAEQLFEFAEQQYPQLFPGRSPTRLFGALNYRYYPASGLYLGIVVGASTEYQAEGVYLMGGAYGDKPVQVGTIGQFLDSDGDGVVNAQDVAPSDPLCAQAQDAYQGSCHWRSMGSATVRILGQSGDLLYLSALGEQALVYAYDLRSGHFTARAALSGFVPTAMVYSAEQARFYMGDAQGRVHAINEAFVEIGKPFAEVKFAVNALAMAGKHLLVQDAAGLTVFDRFGIQTGSGGVFYASIDGAEWNAANSRLYYLTRGISPADVVYAELDSTTGKIKGGGESPYHGDYPIMDPVRINPAGTRLLLGSGNLYSTDTLRWAGKLPTESIADALWLNDSDTVVASRGATRVRLQRFDGTRQLVEAMDLPPGGQLLGLVRRGGDVHWLLQYGDRVQLGVFTPSDDSDKDGVPNGQDKFPLDPAAAADSDGDGHPDAWLAGRSQADSTTGLSLDAYPQDAACHAPEHGNGSVCNPSFYAPKAVPTKVLADGRGMVYLLDAQAARVYRWSASSASFLTPLVVGQPDLAGVRQGPRVFGLSPDGRRLYFGYDNGLVSWMDSAGGAERQFANVASAVGGLVAAGNFVLVQDASGAWDTHTVFDTNGVLRDSQDWNYYSTHYLWAPAQNRVYFYRSSQSPNDLHYEELDPVSGKIASKGETPYHGEHSFYGAMALSPNGARIALGQGLVLSTSDLRVLKDLKESWLDVQWLLDGRLAALLPNGANTRVALYNANSLELEGNLLAEGEPIALSPLGGQSLAVLTRLRDGSFRMTALRP